MTQPVATIIAACIALVAAALTLIGVWLNLRHQTKLAEAKADRDRELEREKAARTKAEVRRTERTTLFAEVLADIETVQKLYFKTAWLTAIKGDDQERVDRLAALADGLKMSALRLELLEYEAPAERVDKYSALMLSHSMSLTFGTLPNEDGTPGERISDVKPDLVFAARKAVLESFRAEVKRTPTA